MATWIAHLRIAENILSEFPELESAPFAVGNIAPDSGIPDEKWEHFDPPAHITHFRVPNQGVQVLADLDFFHKYLLPLKGTDDQRIPFRLGYFFHLVTDNLWSRRIDRPTKERYAAEFASDKNFIWEVKKDWYGLDFLYLNSHPTSIFWHTFLQARAENGGLDFLPLEAVGQRVAYIQEYYQRTGNELQTAINRTYVYLTEEDLDAFVDEATAQLLRIYKQLWINGAFADGLFSALDFSS